jgi:hypothetical protein
MTPPLEWFKDEADSMSCVRHGTPTALDEAERSGRRVVQRESAVGGNFAAPTIRDPGNNSII